MLILMIAACGGCRKENKTVLLATTTSIYDTGLLDEIGKVFSEYSGYIFKTVAVGTGEALRMGCEGVVDVLLVHSKPDEEEFIKKGYGIERVVVMHNDFVILGPALNPAVVEMGDSASAAFKKIARTKSLLVSRGDNSGTHKKEMQIWKKVGIEPRDDWYIESGQGMGASLNIADEKNAYILCDRGTFYSMEKRLRLRILNAGDAELINYYSVIEVKPRGKRKVNSDGARAFREFMVSEKGQKLITDFKRNGEQLFYPGVVKEF